MSMTEQGKPVRAQRAMPSENAGALPLAASGADAATQDGAPLADDGRAALPLVRRGLGAYAKRLDHAIPPGFHGRWINDEAGRIDAAKLDGYAHVMGPDNKPVFKVFGVAKTGGPQNSYLMMLPDHLHEHYQKLKDEPIKQFDASIRRGEVGNQDGRYVPTDAYGKPKINIS